MEEFRELSESVPEYHSANPLVRWIFLRRLDIALEFARLDDEGVLRVADLGCGEGVALRLIRERFPRHEITGVDYNPHISALALPGVSIRRGDLSDPQLLAPGSFDRILCLDVLEHIEKLSTPLASIRRALAPGGLLVISAPSENLFHKTGRFLLKGAFSKKPGYKPDLHYHRSATLRRDIAAAGFEELSSSSLPLPGPLAMLVVSSFRRKD
jgi:trans-aconitate methyltransferase